MGSNQTEIVKDVANKRMKVTRWFDAAPEKVWRAWTESELLEQWWAPKPWRAETKSFEFKNGGEWLYAMAGPDGSKHWAKITYSNIVPRESFEAEDAFCDENGNLTDQFPDMHWTNQFIASASGTKVIVDIAFTSEENLQKIMEMGFQEGFTAALGNLDECLKTDFK